MMGILDPQGRRGYALDPGMPGAGALANKGISQAFWATFHSAGMFSAGASRADNGCIADHGGESPWSLRVVRGTAW